MYDYRVTCSYDELLRFKKSAAVTASTDPSKQGISDARQGLIQVVADNFDCDICSPNGKLSTHSLAMIVMQTGCRDDTDSKVDIKRLKKHEITQPIDDGQDESLVQYHGKKNPMMPTVPAPLQEFDMNADVSQRRAEECDFAFFKDIHVCDQCPEFNGYNMKLSRKHALKTKTKIVYLPLIDRPPANSATMMTALLRAQEVSSNVGQEFMIFTADQQLYRVALHVIWENQARFSNIYLRLGGMHLLMSYSGCVGTLMADTGIVEILGVAFGGVLKMLTGKKFPQNVRALRMLVEELLGPVLEKNHLESMLDLKKTLDEISSESRTAKLWV